MPSTFDSTRHLWPRLFRSLRNSLSAPRERGRDGGAGAAQATDGRVPIETRRRTNLPDDESWATPFGLGQKTLDLQILKRFSGERATRSKGVVVHDEA